MFYLEIKTYSFSKRKTINCALIFLYKPSIYIYCLILEVMNEETQQSFKLCSLRLCLKIRQLFCSNIFFPISLQPLFYLKRSPKNRTYLAKRLRMTSITVVACIITKCEMEEPISSHDP